MRAARALVRWRAEDLAEASKIGIATIRRAEGTDGALSMTPANQAAIRAALEAAGVIFVEENGEGPGVRLKKQAPAVAELTETIHALDEKIAAIDVEGEPSPEIGMNRLKKALVQNEQTNLKNRRTSLRKGKPK
ncbi:conserved protein of unknown function [Methylocella tundrae]|uniref:Transcriptional regulator n=1 Tax=Methylocella tundrae TaxID=227605 RepID=A0A4V6IMH1_METTU|nr:conserved protein of unknown function [Methylocella tundrae]